MVPIIESFISTFGGDLIDVNVNNIVSDEIVGKDAKAIIQFNKVKTKNELDEIDEIILEIYRDKKKIFSTHHYDFECIVRRVFISLGYDVEPTKKTRDGGYDMIARKDDTVPTNHLIECKTSKKKAIGVDVIERFLFKINELKASTGIMVTNLKFSADVIKKYASSTYKYYLKLIDGNELLSMIKNYVESNLRLMFN
ncbi:restriction endonuclease [Siphonobacter sp. BAB-5405]|uniref:restriction endonuclease n=1 Tax=Siphonobacter sp. BAB-5405 TaxID=1864825 RepID=UPI001E5A0AF2|nr:restriction endonuclease [Siphonobacter sp. BAB-5405]